MNHYEQNIFIPVEITTNIIFIIEDKSVIGTLLMELKAAFRELDKLISHKCSADKIIDKSIKINSTIEELFDSALLPSHS